MPATFTVPRRVPAAPGDKRDLFEDFEGFAELVATSGTSQSGETGEGQTILSGTVTPSSGSITCGTVTVSGTKLIAEITFPDNLAVGEYSLRWKATTSGGKTLSRKMIVDVEDI